MSIRNIVTSGTFGISILLSSGQGLASTYYVSNAGSDQNSGLTPDAPLLTLQTAADLTQPGDTVMVRGGTYTPDPKHWHNAILVVNNPGTLAQPISYLAYPGEHPVITNAGSGMVWDAVEILASNIQFVGFEVVGNAQNVTLAQATAVAAAEETAYVASVAAHGADPTVPLAYPRDIATNGACVVISGTTHVAIKSNLIHDCSSSGISAEASDYVFIESNTVFNTSWWSVYETSGINLHQMKNSDRLTTYKNHVLNNIVHDVGNTQPYYNYTYGGGAPTDGNGIIIDSNQRTDDGKPYPGRTLVMANILYNNGGTGIQAYNSAHVDMFNNTAFMNNQCPVAGSDCGNLNSGQIVGNYASDIQIYNNILYSPSGRRPYTNWANSNLSEGHNIVFTVANNPSGYVYPLDRSDIQADPMLTNPGYFAASAQAPAIDAWDAAHPKEAASILRPLKASPARNAGTLYLDNGSRMLITPNAMDGNQGTTVGIGALSSPSAR